MLVKCPECGKEISDKAVACIHCGYPMKKVAVSAPTKTKFRRLPNGFGSIKRLSGKRRRPYICLPPTKTYSDNGSPIYDCIIGYYETYDEAYLALSDYNKNGFSDNSITFAQVYDKWFEDKYVKNQSRQYSESMIRSSKSAYENCKSIQNMPISRIKLENLQKILDNCRLKRASQEIIVNLMHSVFSYAIKYDYIEKDYSQFVQIRIANDDEKGVPFTDKDIAVLWQNKADKAVQIILILIYTGFRINELSTVKLDVKNRCFIGGLKTKAGKDRKVPIHHAIWNFCTAFNSSTFNASKFRNRHFYPVMEKLGMDTAESGEKHTPHDCRHTFSYLCDKYGVDDTAKHLIMGHALSGDVEKTVYTHRTFNDLQTEVEKIETETN